MPALSQAQVQAIQAQLLPIKSKRFRLMEAMRLLMESVTITNGYNTNVIEVSFDVKSWRDKSAPQTPVVYIIDDFTKITKHAGCVREYEWTIRLFGVCREKSMQEFEEFIADLEEAIMTNNSLFGEVNLMWVPEITTDNQMFSEFDGTRLYEMTVVLAFTRRFDMPK